MRHVQSEKKSNPSEMSTWKIIFVLRTKFFNSRNRYRSHGEMCVGCLDTYTYAFPRLHLTILKNNIRNAFSVNIFRF